MLMLCRSDNILAWSFERKNGPAKKCASKIKMFLAFRPSIPWAPRKTIRDITALMQRHSAAPFITVKTWNGLKFQW